MLRTTEKTAAISAVPTPSTASRDDLMRQAGIDPGRDAGADGIDVGGITSGLSCPIAHPFGDR